ncbi:sensor histidine kinase [Denitromonas halophila]|uniref:histidine kinase n=1 Tax=Denitromonas halophila TaxID=1629404 RepID=A0A557QJV3_9RHOO|nr:sensor histidine kinase [Denitromonas halophila]TVO53190.1 sensor histidine kinase [Denitromonas halophila]
MHPRARLDTRVSLVVTLAAAVLMLFGGSLWLAATRDAIHEEIEAATRVAEQWVAVISQDAAADPEHIVQQLAAVGRVRANTLEVHDASGALRYRSPAPTYKAGRDAPAWFAALLTPDFAPRVITGPNLHIRLLPDASRSVLDAWDNAIAAAGWALAILILLGVAVRRAIDRALAPLTEFETALAHTGDGRFDIRLPRQRSLELDRLAERYNQMASQLAASLDQNARLEEDQAFARAVTARLEEERRQLARELHDEFGQGITAVRAITGAIAQKSRDDAGLHGNAQAILAMTGQMQDGVRAILERLRQPGADTPARLDDALTAYCAHWRNCYPAVDLQLGLAPLPATLDASFSLTVLRLVQEALTNVARHANAHHVSVRLDASTTGLALTIADDGRGFDPATPTGRLGLTGMRERLAARHGRLHIAATPGAGTTLSIHLPWPSTAMGQNIPQHAFTPGEPS